MEAKKESADSINYWVVGLQSNGQWRDIDYQGQNPALWNTINHLNRTRSIALAWASPGTVYYHKPELFNVISLAVNHWISVKYQSVNWWYNEIGVPQLCRDIMLLTREKLLPSQFAGLRDILGQLKLKGIGANLIWSADLALHLGAISDNRDLIQEASSKISNEIKISTQEGIQPDYSYHQHQARLQIYHYGKAYIEDNIRLAWQLRGTQWAIEQNKLNILGDFVAQGWQWMARGVNTSPATLDRSVSRPGSLQNAGLNPYLSYLSELLPEKRAVFERLSRAQMNSENSVSGYRYFPYSDFAAFQDHDFSFFLKTISTRTEVSEKINGENLKGDFLNFGNTYFIRNGQEYLNLMPVWNWDKLPGVTNFEGAKNIIRGDVNGGISSGKAGFVVMRVNSGNDSLNFQTTKLWADYKNVMICLIADISLNNNDKQIFTTMDQSRVQGEVTINKPGMVLRRGLHEFDHLQWVFHAGFAYVPLGAEKIKLQVDTARGFWNQINRSGSPKLVAEEVFMPTLLHKNHSNTAYAVLAAQSADVVPEILAKPFWEIIGNNKYFQAIEFDNQILMASFYKTGEFKLKKRTIAVSRPCLILLEDKQITLSDPSFKGGDIKIVLNSKVYKCRLPEKGKAVMLKL